MGRQKQSSRDLSSKPFFLIGSMSSRSFRCQPQGHEAKNSMVALSRSYRGDFQQRARLRTFNRVV